MTFNIKAFVNNAFSLGTVLRVLDINLDHSYVRFGRHFDNTGSRHENNIIENISSLDNFLNDI